MGFFDSKTTSESESTYDNPELRQYTAAYRGAAPWGFASLDPTATLFAMGGGTKLGGTELGQGMKDHLKGLSDDEKKQRQETDDALARIKTRQESGQFLTPQETEFINTSLDKAFEFARKTGYEDWSKATQMMAGSRGMRMSDTPVAEPAMRELRNFELGLGSERAKLGVAATLDMSQNKQAFDLSIAQFNKQLQQNTWATQQGHLFGGGLQAAGQLGFKTTEKNTVTKGMSGFQQVMAGFQMANATLDLGGRIGQGIMSGGKSFGQSPKPAA
jgi:hypothetical protein